VVQVYECYYEGVIKGWTALRAALGDPHVGGGAVPGSTQGSRYVQVGIGTCILSVSEGLAQPLPALMVFLAVKVGTGNVGMGPVGV